MNEQDLFPLTDEPMNKEGKPLFFLSEDALAFIQRLLYNFTRYKLVPYLQLKCEDTVEEKCVLNLIPVLPWKGAVALMIQNVESSGHLMFPAGLFRRFLQQSGDFLYVDEESTYILLRILQWVAMSIYQCIQDYQLTMGRKRIVTVMTIFEALHEDEILSDVLRGLALN